MNIEPYEFTHQRSRPVTAPLPEVWRLHRDTGTWPSWDGDVVAVTPARPMAPRAAFTVTTAQGGWNVRVYALTEQELTFFGDVVDDRSRWLQSWIFEESPGGVHVTVTTAVLGSSADVCAELAGGLRVAADTRLSRLRRRAELAARGA